MRTKSLLYARPRFKRSGYVIDETAPRAVAFAVLREIRLHQFRLRKLRDEDEAGLADVYQARLIGVADVACYVREAIMELR